MNYDGDAFVFFLFFTGFVYGLYPFVSSTTARFVNNTPSQARWESLKDDKKQYFVKNIIKSIVLAFLSIYCLIYITLPVLKENVWNNYRIKRCAVIYVSNDLAGLIRVDNLPKTTKIHHLTTTILVTLALSLDFQQSSLAQAMFVYTMASSMAYIVNLHLAIRLICHSCSRGIQQLRRFASGIYGITLTMGWSYHIQWIYKEYKGFIWLHFLYLFLLLLIIRDDVILMYWLLNKNKKVRPTSSNVMD